MATAEALNGTIERGELVSDGDVKLTTKRWLSETLRGTGEAVNLQP